MISYKDPNFMEECRKCLSDDDIARVKNEARTFVYEIKKQLEVSAV